MVLSEKSRTYRLSVLALIWLVSAIYVGGFVRKGWIPVDEGVLASAAEKQLHGELPHRDFEGGYTGGLEYLHALAFRVLGTRLLTMRIVLFVFFVASVPIVYLMARRFWQPLPAAALTALAVAWSVPNYFASMPSWYNLFLALFGAAAALRFLDTKKRRWLFVAGFCGGLSVLAKITGLYFVAALLLFLVHVEQAGRDAEEAPVRERSWLYTLFVAGSLVIFVALLILVIQRRAAPMEILHFVVPGGAVCGYLIWYEWRAGRRPSAARSRDLVGLLWPAALGVFLPIGVYLVPYVVSGSLVSGIQSFAVSTRRQLETPRSTRYLPPLSKFWFAMPYLALVAVPALWPRRRRGLAAGALAVALAAVLIATSGVGVYRAVWLSARSLAVVAVLAGCRLLVTAGESDLERRRRLELFLLLCVTATISLVQIPFSAPIYFCFAAPAVALALAAVIASTPGSPRAAHGVVLGFYLAFALWRMNPGYVFALGDRPEVYRAAYPLEIERAGLLVPEAEGRMYEELVLAISRVDPGPVLFVAPDCPEVSFLSARKSPLSVFLDFQGPLYEKHDALLRLLDAEGVRAVVINRTPTFSRRLRPEFEAELARRFPRSREIGHFVLRWADRPGSPPL